MPTGKDFASIERSIGELVGMLSPIPDQLNTLFQKIDIEKDERTKEDRKVALEMQSIRDNVERLSRNIKDIEERMRDMRCQEHMKTLENVEKILADLRSTIRDIVRLLRLADGRSEWVDGVEEKHREIDAAIVALERKIAPLINTNKTIWGVFKNVGDRMLTIAIALLIAYLVYRFGWK